MSYSQAAQLEILNAAASISTKAEFEEFRNLIAHFFASKAQKAIDELWENGSINEQTIDKWGKEHLRTPYHANNRS